MTCFDREYKLAENQISGSTKRIALIDDCETEHFLLRFRLSSKFKPDEYVLHSAYNLGEGIALLKENEVDIIFLDNRLKPNKDFTETLPHILEVSGEAKIYVISSSVVDPVYKYLDDFAIEGLIDKLLLGNMIANEDLLMAA